MTRLRILLASLILVGAAIALIALPLFAAHQVREAADIYEQGLERGRERIAEAEVLIKELRSDTRTEDEQRADKYDEVLAETGDEAAAREAAESMAPSHEMAERVAAAVVEHKERLDEAELAIEGFRKHPLWPTPPTHQGEVP